MSEFIEAVSDPYDDTSYLSYRLVPETPNARETIELEVRFGYWGAERLNAPNKLYKDVCVSYRETNGSTICENIIDDISELKVQWVPMKNLGVSGHTDDLSVEYNVYRSFRAQITLNNEASCIEVHVKDNDSHLTWKALDVAFQVYPDPFAQVGFSGLKSSADEMLLDSMTHGDSSKAEKALKAGANPNLKKGKSSIYKQARYYDEIQIMALLIEYGADNDLMLKDMKKIIESGRAAAVKILIDKGVEIPTKTYGAPLLYTAARKNLLEMVSLLSEQGIDLNEGNKQHTPLTIAIMQNDREMACKLLELGADPNMTAAAVI